MNTATPATPATPVTPAPSAFEHYGFKIVPLKIRSRTDGTIKTMLAVQCNENREREKRGERQIGGDCLFDTKEAAMAEAERQWERMEAQLASAVAAKLKSQSRKSDAAANAALRQTATSKLGS